MLYLYMYVYMYIMVIIPFFYIIMYTFFLYNYSVLYVLDVLTHKALQISVFGCFFSTCEVEVDAAIYRVGSWLP